MAKIGIFTITSELHDPSAVAKMTSDFLGSLGVDYEFYDNDYSTYGSHSLNLIYVRTGGTENIFRKLQPKLSDASDRPFYLLTSGMSNSLAASMEILSFLRQHGLYGEIIHGKPQYIRKRMNELVSLVEAKRKLALMRLGVIGNPSDWLISSNADRPLLREYFGLKLIDIPMKELVDLVPSMSDNAPVEINAPESIAHSMPDAWRIYNALKVILERHQLNGYTLRCFDLLKTVENTGCLAAAQLNSEGYIAGCEGDIPAMVSMAVVRALFGVSGFQANPARIDPETGEILFAHCTIPFNMLDNYKLDTHFESGIGVGICGYMKNGPVTIFKFAGDASRYFLAEGELVESDDKPGLCRTQQLIRLNEPEYTMSMLTNPVGNHHIIIPGHHKQLIRQLLTT
ncbi:MAG: hypothetical protein IJU35_02285 [Paludibacteraceae bacterium]|nr:hypothetical protein [Paludibacteraceae bacterium]